MAKEGIGLDIPEELTNPGRLYPAVWVDTSAADWNLEETQERIQTLLRKALELVQEARVSGQCLIKVHIGEPSCETRMKPRFCRPAAEFLLERGASGVVYGDTTVAYTGPRGYRQNPTEEGTAKKYTALAERHGWSARGDGGAPFVVLDRPATSIDGVFEFETEELLQECPGTQIFNDFYVAGGFRAAEFTANQAHLTLHGLAGVAGCVKSVAMGCASLTGKLRMHQSLTPVFREELCTGCRRCVLNCPEDALRLESGMAFPVVEEDSCIGCGECVSICSQGAIRLRSKEISDWTRGQDTISRRMADYVVGLLDGRWQDLVHVLHLVDVTPLCDCVDVHQDPLTRTQLGFLVGKNPFALDVLGARLFARRLKEEGAPFDAAAWDTAEETARYAAESYGIAFEAPLEVLKA